MSVATEIARINANIAASYAQCQSKGATMPSAQNSANLANCIASIPQSGSLPDYRAVYKEITLTSSSSSSSYTLMTNAELLQAGLIDGSGQLFPNLWMFNSVSLVADEDIAHAPKQLRAYYWFPYPVNISTTSKNYGIRMYHGNSTTSLSTSLKTGNYVTSASGTIYVNSSGDLIWYGSSSYVLSAGTYHLCIQCAIKSNGYSLYDPEEPVEEEEPTGE